MANFFFRRVRPWLRLCRLPNLPTVPGDILAGYVLVGGAADFDETAVFGIIILSLSLYLSGLFLNDWCDQKIDKEERPDRPIPSGNVHAGSVATASLFGFFLALGISLSYSMSTTFITCILVMLIILYNRYTKNIQGLGLTVMASCRAMNLLLGVSIVGFDAQYAHAILLAASLLFYYIIVLSYLAKMEMTRLPSNFAKCLVIITPLFSLLLALTNRGFAMNWVGFGVAWMMFAVNTVLIIGRIHRNKNQQRMSAYIGQLIRNLIFLQCTIMASGGASYFLILVLMLHWPIATSLGKKFYGS